MKKEVADAWVADLRTNPPQTKNKLFDGKGHCCLGRLCLVLGAEFEKRNGEWHPRFPEGLSEKYTSLDAIAMEKSGMKDSEGWVQILETGMCKYLSAMNDTGWTFSEIADIIEQKWETL